MGDEALDDQPESILQGDRVPARKMEQCQGDSARQAQPLCKNCADEWEANAMCHAL